MAERLIFHIDVNSAFLNWENKERHLADPSSPNLLTIPAAIGGDSTTRHGIVLAKSPIAKSMGISTGEPIATALRKCPNLLVLPTNFPAYSKNSAQLMQLLSEYSPDMQQFSIDEAFIDMTKTIHLFGEPYAVADQIRTRVQNELGFTVNIGISSNKLLAKMASDFEKPNKCHTLFPNEISDKMWPLPVNELFLVGRSAKSKLTLMGIRTIGDLAKANELYLQSQLGAKYASMILKYANGIDDSPVEPEVPENKGIGNSTTLSVDITETEAALQILLLLCESVGERVRKAGYKGTCVTVELRDNDFKNYSHQTTLPTPTNSTQTIYEIACALLKDFWHGTPLRLLGVRLTHLTNNEFEQMVFFEDATSKKREQLDKAIDTIRERFGSNSVKRASVINTENPKFKK